MSSRCTDLQKSNVKPPNALFFRSKISSRTPSTIKMSAQTTKKRALEGTLKGDDVKRRVVYKSLLEDPYTKAVW